ncbi:MAG: ISKra4 family transposase [Holophaga sp.]|nr:ISKra4 family transposase [Holophaga sp.]
MGRGFFPLDEELQLLPGCLTPHGHECLVRLSGWMPFEKAAELLEDMLGIRVSKGVSQRYTEAAGAAYEQLQTEEVERLEKEAPEPKMGAEKLQISADGAMVPLVHGVWAEVRTVVIGEVVSKVDREGQQVAHAENLSYFSRKINAQTFQRLALVEMHRRNVEKARQVAAVMDGAEWEQGFADYHCPLATRILDFPHAAEHVNLIGEAVYGQHTPESRAWLGDRLHRLKHEGPDQILLEFQQLQQAHPEKEAITSNLAYLEKRRVQMQYPEFQAQGWPIGSGIVESANKLVVEARLKGSGMHWADKHVNPMLALRNVICSDRWKEEWPKVEAKIRLQARERRTHLHCSRKVAPAAEPVPPKPLVDDLILQHVAERIAQDGEPKKPRPNPWRNFKHGKALYQPSSPPKN